MAGARIVLGMNPAAPACSEALIRSGLVSPEKITIGVVGSSFCMARKPASPFIPGMRRSSSTSDASSGALGGVQGLGQRGGVQNIDLGVEFLQIDLQRIADEVVIVGQNNAHCLRRLLHRVSCGSGTFGTRFAVLSCNLRCRCMFLHLMLRSFGYRLRARLPTNRCSVCSLLRGVGFANSRHVCPPHHCRRPNRLRRESREARAAMSAWPVGLSSSLQALGQQVLASP